MTGLFHALLNGLTPLTNGLDPFVAWDIRGVVFPIVAILVVALGGFAASCPGCRLAHRHSEASASRNASGPFAFR